MADKTASQASKPEFRVVSSSPPAFGSDCLLSKSKGSRSKAGKKKSKKTCHRRKSSGASSVADRLPLAKSPKRNDGYLWQRQSREW